MKKASLFFSLPALVLFLCTLLCFSCQNNSGSTADGQTESSGQAAAQGLITEAAQLPGAVNFEGQFLQAAHWQSEGTDYYVAISKYEQGEFFTPNWVSRLNIYLYELSQGTVTRRRSFQAESPNIYSEASLHPERTALVELPSLGKAVALAYDICPDGEDPCTLYATVISPEGKYDFQAMQGVDPNIYREERMSIMVDVPEDVQLELLNRLFPE